MIFNRRGNSKNKTIYEEQVYVAEDVDITEEQQQEFTDEMEDKKIQINKDFEKFESQLRKKYKGFYVGGFFILTTKTEKNGLTALNNFSSAKFQGLTPKEAEIVSKDAFSVVEKFDEEVKNRQKAEIEMEEHNWSDERKKLYSIILGEETLKEWKEKGWFKESGELDVKNEEVYKRLDEAVGKLSKEKTLEVAKILTNRLEDIASSLKEE